eukprot:10827297-Ditylum_brightwellii.AAC.1
MDQDIADHNMNMSPYPKDVFVIADSMELSILPPPLSSAPTADVTSPPPEEEEEESKIKPANAATQPLQTFLSTLLNPSNKTDDNG